jgi:hypothetical protein
MIEVRERAIARRETAFVGETFQRAVETSKAA